MRALGGNANGGWWLGTPRPDAPRVGANYGVGEAGATAANCSCAAAAGRPLSSAGQCQTKLGKNTELFNDIGVDSIRTEESTASRAQQALLPLGPSMITLT